MTEIGVLSELFVKLLLSHDVSFLGLFDTYNRGSNLQTAVLQRQLYRYARPERSVVDIPDCVREEHECATYAGHHVLRRAVGRGVSTKSNAGTLCRKYYSII